MFLGLLIFCIGLITMLFTNTSDSLHPETEEVLQAFYDIRGNNYPYGETNYLYDGFISQGMCGGIFSEESGILLGGYYAERIVEATPADTAEWGANGRAGLKEEWGYPVNPNTEIAWDIIKDQIREDVLTTCRKVDA